MTTPIIPIASLIYRGFQLAQICAVCIFSVGCRTEQVARKQAFIDCISEVEMLGEHGKPVPWESVREVLERRTSDFHQIDGGSDMGIDYREYEMTISGDDYWIDMTGQGRGPSMGGWLEVHTLIVRKGLASDQGEVVADLDFREQIKKPNKSEMATPRKPSD